MHTTKKNRWASDPDQAQYLIGPDLGTNCWYRLLTDSKDLTNIKELQIAFTNTFKSIFENSVDTDYLASENQWFFFHSVH